MIKHHLRELRDLCSYSIVGVGTSPATLTGLIFDAKDWSIRSYVVKQEALHREPFVIPLTCFCSLDDVRRELRLDVREELLVSPKHLRPETLAKSTQFDAVAFLGQLIDARNGPAGKISDLLINVDLWVLRYFVIETDERRVLADIEWASSLTEGQERLLVDLPAEAIATAPRYESLGKLCQGDEEALYRHYTRTTHLAQDVTA